MRDQKHSLVPGCRRVREITYIAADLSFIQGLECCFLIHQTVSCKIQNDCILLHHGDRFRADHTLGGIHQRYMDRNIVALSVDRLYIGDMADRTIQIPCPANGNERIVSVDFHAQSYCGVCYHVSDRAKSDHAQFLAGDLSSCILFLLFLDRLGNVLVISIRTDPVHASDNIAGSKQHAGKDHLLYTICVCAGSIEYDNASGGTVIERNIVHACACAGYGQDTLIQFHLVHVGASYQDRICSFCVFALLIIPIKTT